MIPSTDIFGYIGNYRKYANNPDQFKQDYSKEYQLVCPDGKYSQNKILAVYCLGEISKENNVEIITCKKILAGQKKVKNIFTRIVDNYNNKLSKSQRKLQLIHAKKYDGKIVVIVGQLEETSTLTKRKTKLNRKTSRQFFSVLFDKEQNKCYFYKTPYKFKELILWWLKTKRLIVANEFEPIKLEPSEINSIFSKNNQKMYSISLQRTIAPGPGESVIIVSNSGKAFEQARAWENAKILKISLDTLNSIKMSIGEEATAKIDFNRSKFGKKVSYFGSRKSIPDKLKEIMDKQQPLYDTLNFDDILNNIIYKENVETYYFRLPEIGERLSKVVREKLLYKRPKSLRFCSNQNCDITRPVRKKVCSCGIAPKRAFVYSYSIKPNKAQILKKTRQLLQELGIQSKKYPGKMLNLNKKDFVLKVRKGDSYFYLYFNKTGLGKDNLQDLKTLGTPIILVKFKGELDSNLVGIANIDAIRFLPWIATNNKRKLNLFIEDGLTKSSELVNEAFRISVGKISSTSTPTAQEFENTIYCLFNYIFSDNQKLGGPKLADGSFAFYNKGSTEYALWDAKRYTKTSLAAYVSSTISSRAKFSTDISKDIRYMSKFEKNFIVKKHGGLKYYIFVTYNTDKGDFDNAKIALLDQLKKTKNKLFKASKSRIWISCINQDQLLKLCKYIARKPLVLTNNRQKFYQIIKKALRENNGYFDFDLTKGELDKLAASRQPSVKRLRHK